MENGGTNVTVSSVYRIEEKNSKVVPGPGTYNIAGLSEKGKDFCAAPTIAAKLKVCCLFHIKSYDTHMR